MATKFDEFKEGKKAMEDKMTEAHKTIDCAIDEFIGKLKSLAKDMTEEELKQFLESDDEMVEEEDKLAIIAAFAETHKHGIVALGIF